MNDLIHLLGKIDEITSAPQQSAPTANTQPTPLEESISKELDAFLSEANDFPSDYERIKSGTPAKKSKGLSSFGQAFKTARAAGEKTFTFRGQRYTTAMKGETPEPTTGVDFPAASGKETEWEAQRARMIQRAEKPSAPGIPEVDIERVIPEAAGDTVDTVTMDVPLLMRIMEYAREDAKTDMDLHHVAEQMIAMNKEQDHLTMDDYHAIISKTQPEEPAQEGEVYESDISGLLAASTLNHAYIFTVETAEGVKKKFRVRAQSERVAREKFSRHHAQAKILDVRQEY
jgi:hypothetical protein